MISDLTNLPVPVLAESESKPYSSRRESRGEDSKARESTTVNPRCSLHSRGGQKHLPANRRAKLRELRSRVSILQKAFVRTRSIACADLYRKAIKVARCDIAELGESYD